MKHATWFYIAAGVNLSSILAFNIDEIEQMIKKTKSPRLPPIPKRPSQKSQAQAQNQAQKLASEIDPSRVTLHRTPQKTPTPITPPFHSNTSSDRESASPSPKTKIAESPTSRLANNGPQKQATTSPIPSPIYKQQPLPKPALSQQQLPAPAVPITPVQYQLPPSPMQTPQPRAPIQFNLNPANTFVKKGPPKAPATDDLFWKTGYPVSIPENRFQLGQNRVINPDTASSSTTRYPHGKQVF